MGKWIPNPFRRRQKKFLPPLPKHSDTGVMAAIKDTPRRRKLASRTIIALIIRWRYFVTSIVALTLASTTIVTSMITLRDAFNDSSRLPSQTAPTLDQLNSSIRLGAHYVSSLYKPLPGGAAVQSEASGVPLKVHFLDEDAWVLLGEDKTECVDGKGHCHDTTSIQHPGQDATHDHYTAAFSTRTKRDALVVRVDIDWAFNSHQYRVQITPQIVKERAELWLDTTQLRTIPIGDKTPSERLFNSEDLSQLRMLRFTTRHATQEAYLFYKTNQRNPKRAAALGSFLGRNGFTPGFDLRAPLFDGGDQLPDDLPTNGKSYPDCELLATDGEFAYAYRSKVCLYEGLYLDSGERDPFLQAWAALTVLMKYNDPNRHQPGWGWWTQGDTPAAISRHLRGQWNRSGYGIPKCTPFSCGELSSIRTSVFGVLETQLGYVYGDTSSQRFADAAAKVITQTQVKADGTFTADNGTTYKRPGQAGSYLTAWSGSKLRFTEPSTPKLPVALALWLRGARPTPLEYKGVVPSNSETSLDALSFLITYRCQKYKVCM